MGGDSWFSEQKVVSFCNKIALLEKSGKEAGAWPILETL